MRTEDRELVERENSLLPTLRVVGLPISARVETTMKDFKNFPLVAFIAGLFLTSARAQSFLDLKRLIDESSRRSVDIVTVGEARSTSHKVILQYGLAPVIVGFSPQGSPVGYRLMLLATVPADIAEADEKLVRGAIRGIVKPITEELREKIDALPGPEESGATAAKAGEDVRQHFENYATNTNNQARDAFTAASHEFRQRFGQRFPKHARLSFMAVGLRPCADPACPLAEFANRRRDRSTDRFGKLYGWMKSEGLTTANQAYILNPQKTFWSITAKLDKGYEWHDDIPKAALQAALVNAANRARRTKVPLSYSAAELAGLSNEATAHIADVFDSAYAAAIRLPSNPNLVLKEISDELGRARLTECVRLRGTFDATAAGTCAGYALTPAALATCISGGECSPSFGSQVNLDSLTIMPHTAMAYFAQNAALPRIDLGTLDQSPEP